MKKIFLGLTLILSASVISASAQSVATAKPASTSTSSAAAAISFKEPEFTHDFGAIPQGTPVSYNFVFTNTGKAPLVLSNAVGSCGCTAAEWPKEAIAPGKTGVVKVTYNASSPNTFDRTVTLTSNATNPSVVLHIKGDVKVPATSAQAPTAPATQVVAPKKN